MFIYIYIYTYIMFNLFGIFPFVNRPKGNIKNLQEVKSHGRDYLIIVHVRSNVET